MTEQQLPLLSRATDPPSSREAAERHAEAAGSHRATLLEAVRRSPGHTSAELARETELDRHEAARRLPELRAAGKVTNGQARDCSVGRGRAMTWWPR